ncbi:MAG: SH3-like domain-containing protein [Saprospiraceae bacterium]|nr:SH3-like domain-containing protein [Saprospiraceae bacterium]
MKFQAFLFPVLFVFVALSSCGNDAEVIKADSTASTGDGTAPMFQDPGAATMQGGVNTAPGQPNLDVAEHKIKAEEVLNTDKYTYVRGQENGQDIWIAVLKQEVKIGSNYTFRGGLMKKNFESKEFNRSFETLYLVSDFGPEGAAGTTAAPGSNPHANVQGGSTVEAPKSVSAAAGAIKIADLVANLKKYEGKTVKVTGKVMKVNNMIMGRNWVHLQDGSGKNLDLTLTTVEQVQLGETITLEGNLTLNKDFGAGYKYDYIIESAVKK